MTNPMIRRVAAVEATMARFNGRPFQWGRNDCARMAAFCVRRLGVKVSLLKAGDYSSLKTALRRLEALGVGTMPELLDLHFPSIAPAAALPGDLVSLPSDEGMGDALAVYVGNGRVLGFMGGRCGVVQPIKSLVSAWRVI